MLRMSKRLIFGADRNIDQRQRLVTCIQHQHQHLFFGVVSYIDKKCSSIRGVLTVFMVEENEPAGLNAISVLRSRIMVGRV
ncbi:MAG: hypothetical protein ACD_23C01023G0006 [uncultured bacterium]|nr:MAG: hypothetical protein ACD_23C01023G0006 [uncultured bacterium]